jgi:hypothetical protein
MINTPQTSTGHSYTAEIRFTGEHLDPSSISKRIGLEPTNSRTLANARSKGRIARPFWAYNGQNEPGFNSEWHSLEFGLEFLLRRLAPKQATVLELSREHEGVLWCGHFQTSFDGGPVLSPKILMEIAGFGLPLFIDNYFSD